MSWASQASKSSWADDAEQEEQLKAQGKDAEPIPEYDDTQHKGQSQSQHELPASSDGGGFAGENKPSASSPIFFQSSTTPLVMKKFTFSSLGLMRSLPSVFLPATLTMPQPPDTPTTVSLGFIAS
jgi:hypothetical protein